MKKTLLVLAAAVLTLSLTAPTASATQPVCPTINCQAR